MNLSDCKPGLRVTKIKPADSDRVSGFIVPGYSANGQGEKIVNILFDGFSTVESIHPGNLRAMEGGGPKAPPTDAEIDHVARIIARAYWNGRLYGIECRESNIKSAMVETAAALDAENCRGSALVALVGPKG